MLFLGLNSCICLGGFSVYENRRRIIKSRPQILIGTPGRLKQLVSELECVNLFSVNFVGLIQADKFLQNLGNDSQSILTDFSAVLSLLPIGYNYLSISSVTDLDISPLFGSNHINCHESDLICPVLGKRQNLDEFYEEYLR